AAAGARRRSARRPGLDRARGAGAGARRARTDPHPRCGARCPWPDAGRCRREGVMTNRVPEIPFEARAYQDFVRGLRGVWRGNAYARTLDDARPIAAETVRALE